MILYAFVKTYLDSTVAADDKDLVIECYNLGLWRAHLLQRITCCSVN